MEEKRITVLEKNAPALKLSTNGLKQLDAVNKHIVHALQLSLRTGKQVLVILEEIVSVHKQFISGFKQCVTANKKIVNRRRMIVLLPEQLVKAHKEIVTTLEQFVIWVFSIGMAVFQLETKDLCFNIEIRYPVKLSGKTISQKDTKAQTRRMIK